MKLTKAREIQLKNTYCHIVPNLHLLKCKQLLLYSEADLTLMQLLGFLDLSYLKSCLVNAWVVRCFGTAGILFGNQVINQTDLQMSYLSST